MEEVLCSAMKMHQESNIMEWVYTFLFSWSLTTAYNGIYHLKTIRRMFLPQISLNIKLNWKKCFFSTVARIVRSNLWWPLKVLLAEQVTALLIIFAKTIQFFFPVTLPPPSVSNFLWYKIVFNYKWSLMSFASQETMVFIKVSCLLLLLRGTMKSLSENLFL